VFGCSGSAGRIRTYNKRLNRASFYH